MTTTFSSTSRVLLASALCLATAGCKVSTGGLLSKVGGPGSSSNSGASEPEAADTSSSSSDDASASSDSGQADRGDTATTAPFDVPYYAPAPGVVAVGAYKAPWCTKAEPSANWNPGSLSRTISGDYWKDTAKTAAPILCMMPDDSRFQKLVGAYVQRFVNETGASPAQVSEYLALFRQEGNYEELAAETCKKYQPDEEASGREQAVSRMAAEVVGCDGFGQVHFPVWMSSSVRLDFKLNGLWHVDREAALPSQLVAIHHVLGCVAGGKPDDIDALVKYAGCRADVKQLDEKKLAAELKAEGHNAQAKAVAVLALQKAKYRASLFEKALLAKTAADAELKQLLVDAPEQAWKDWVEARKANKAAIDAARAYEDRYNGGRKSAAQGCSGDARKHLDAYTAAHSGRDRDALMDAVTDPVGIILFEYARSCYEMEGDALAADIMQRFIESGLPSRGPRVAAQVAMAAVVAGIVSDRPKFAVKPDMLPLGSLRSPVPMGYGNRSRTGGDKAGIVAKVERKGERVYVTFKTDKWVEDEQDCHNGSRIVMFQNDGTPIYEWLCKNTGRKVTRSDTSEPFYTSPELARGITAGTFVRYGTGIERDDSNIFVGVPNEVWKTKDQKDLVAVYGILAR